MARGSRSGGTFSKLGGLIDLGIDKGLDSLEDLVDRLREGLAEYDEMHTARRHGRNAAVLDPLIEMMAADDWIEVGQILRSLNSNELRRLRSLAQESHERISAVAGSAATLRLTRMVDAERERRSRERQAQRSSIRRGRSQAVSRRLKRAIGRSPSQDLEPRGDR